MWRVRYRTPGARRDAARTFPIGCLALPPWPFWRPACQRSAPRPSIVLAVLDTTRADAVSAYGEVEGTTPNVDALARQGLLYEHAYANANWTLPSHATIFTGLLPIENGVRGGADKLESVPTLAEILGKAGYETFGVNENPWLTPENGLSRGFDRWVPGGSHMAKTVEKWLAGRAKNRPFFLFLNIMNAHWPYLVREDNPYLPAGVGVERARSISKNKDSCLCRCTPDDPNVLVLRALYLDSVRAADAKLGDVLAALGSVESPVIVIATGDHGERFGEHGLLEHDVGLDRAVLHVPLVVHGLHGVAPARISAPVQLADLMPAILGWAGVAAPPRLTGRPLPTTEPAPGPEPPIISEFHDYFVAFVESTVPEKGRPLLEASERRWRHCTKDDRISGDMRSVIRYPYEYIWYEKYSPQLFDLRADPREEHDLSSARPDTVADLETTLHRKLASAASSPRAGRVQLDPAQVERLRALGYLGGAAAGGRKATAGGTGP